MGQDGGSHPSEGEAKSASYAEESEEDVTRPLLAKSTPIEHGPEFHVPDLSSMKWRCILVTVLLAVLTAVMTIAITLLVLKYQHVPEPIDEHKHIQPNAKFQSLKGRQGFDALSVKHRKYAHYFSGASWRGSLITMIQTSPESPLIFVLVSKLLDLQTDLAKLVDYLKEKHSFTHSEVDKLFLYSAAFLHNQGNYRTSSNIKFIPEVPLQKMESLVKELIPDDDRFEYFYHHGVLPMYSYEPNKRQIGMPPKGVTGFYGGCNSSDIEPLREYLQHKSVEPWNQRVFKTQNGSLVNYELRIASNETSSMVDLIMIDKVEAFKGRNFTFKDSDYSPLLGQVVELLRLAMAEAPSEEHQKTLQLYMDYFKSGSLKAHKEATALWINQTAQVEAHIGFVETYRDPAGVRAEFQGVVGVVNVPEGKVFEELSKRGSDFIKFLPWPREFENEPFKAPTFVALDIICATGTVPAAVNLPNYNDVRQRSGSKNVQLNNVINIIYGTDSVKFVDETDEKKMLDYWNKAFQVQTGTHELLGHGSGKEFVAYGDGGFNFDVNNTIDPLTNQTVKSWYRVGENFQSVFGALQNTFDECRAEAVFLRLSLHPDVLEVFGHFGAESRAVSHVSWMSLMIKALDGLKNYDAYNDEWKGAHSNARFVLLRVIREEAPNVIQIHVDGSKMILKVDSELIFEEGQKAISKFLLKLQVYKSTANFVEAKKLFDYYSKVDKESPSGDDFLAIRRIVLQNETPAAMLVQPNTKIEGDDVLLKEYSSTMDGQLMSWKERFSEIEKEQIYFDLEALHRKDIGYYIH